jgi:hypothetical protein
MLNPSYTNQFQKDLKLMLRRGKPVEKFKEVAKREFKGKRLSFFKSSISKIFTPRFRSLSTIGFEVFRVKLATFFI